VLQHFPFLFCFSILFTPGYSSKYIYKNFKKFFINKLSPTSITPRIATENHFRFVRSSVFNKPIATEHQIASQIAQTIDLLNGQTIDDPLVRMCIKKASKFFQNLIIRCTHEERLRNSNQ
jgi:hypothetical protein